MRFPAPTLPKTVLSLALLAAAAACGSDKATAPAGTIVLAVAPSSVTVAQGNSAQVVATLTRTNYPGSVSFSVDDEPAGVTASAVVGQTTGNATTVVVNVVVGANAATGTYTLELTGKGAGATEASKTFTLVVTPAGSFSLALSAGNSLSLKQGMSNNSLAIAVARTNYNSPVTFTAENLPAGVTATFAENPSNGNAAQMTLSAAPETQTGGPFAVIIRGTGPAAGTNPGLPPVTTTAVLQLTITPAGSFTLSVQPNNALTLMQGTGDNSRTISISRSDYAEAIALVAENLPTGVTASFTPNPAQGGTAQLSLSAAANAASGGPVTVTIRGTGPAGVSLGANSTDVQATTTLQLTVIPTPNYTLSVAPAQVSIEQGQGRNDIAVSLARTSFNGAVTLALGGNVPSGVTASFAPATPTGNSSTLTVTVDAATPTGTYPLTITGNGAPGVRTVPFSLTVIPAPPPQGTFTLSMPAPCSQTFQIRQGALDDRRIVSINRDNLPNPIQFSVQGLPSGLTATLDGNPVTGNTVRITFVAAPDAAPGDHIVTLRGIVAGGSPVTLPFSINVHAVDPADDDPTVLSYDFTNASAGGWRRGVLCPGPIFGNPDYGAVTFQEDMIVLEGRGPSSGRMEPNSWLSRTIQLPANAQKFRFDATAHRLAFCQEHCQTRVRVRVFEGLTSTIVLDQQINWISPGGVFAPYEANIAPWAGKTVRIFLEQLDPETSHVQLWVDSFRILGPPT